MKKNILAMVLADVRHIQRDAMLMLALLGIILLILVYQMGVPFIVTFFSKTFSFSLYHYMDLFFYIFLLLIPLLLGIIVGFLMLEERDIHVISYFSITPIGKKGYFFYRLATPFILTMCATILYIALSDWEGGSIIWRVGIVLLIALLAPLISLFLVAFASNRVEGLALSKGSGFLIIAPFVLFFVPEKMQWVAGGLPTFWIVKSMEAIQSGTYMISFYYWIGFGFQILLLFILYRKFSLRIG